jgi:hypothetical protein
MKGRFARFVNEGDPVERVPPFFRHFGSRVLFTPNGIRRSNMVHGDPSEKRARRVDEETPTRYLARGRRRLDSRQPTGSRRASKARQMVPLTYMGRRGPDDTRIVKFHPHGRTLTCRFARRSVTAGCVIEPGGDGGRSCFAL